MLIIGLTGGIGMGKSTAARIFAGFGLPVHSADEAVHALLGKNGKAVKKIARIFPESVRDGAIDRHLLAQLVFGKPRKLKKLEAVLHPLVRQAEREFLRAARHDKRVAAVLEIPLLFETGAEKRCDVVLCVTAPRAVQKARVLRRKGMTAARFKAIVRRQMPDAEKKKRADFIIKTGEGLADTRRQLERILERLGE